MVLEMCGENEAMRLLEGAKYLQFNRFEETAESFFLGK
jgi:hypothetical protein